MSTVARGFRVVPPARDRRPPGVVRGGVPGGRIQNARPVLPGVSPHGGDGASRCGRRVCIGRDPGGRATPLDRRRRRGGQRPKSGDEMDECNCLYCQAEEDGFPDSYYDRDDRDD